MFLNQTIITDAFRSVFLPECNIKCREPGPLKPELWKQDLLFRVGIKKKTHANNESSALTFFFIELFHIPSLFAAIPHSALIYCAAINAEFVSVCLYDQ